MKLRQQVCIKKLSKLNSLFFTM